MDLCTTARAGSGFSPTRYYSGRVSRPRLGFGLVQNLLQPITMKQHLRNIWVSRANISFQLSYRFVNSSVGSCFNCTALPVRRNPRPAQQDYRAPSASACRTVFARAAHRVVCRVCPCRLVMLWLVPGRGRACQLLRFLNVARPTEPSSLSGAGSSHIQAVATILPGSGFRDLLFMGSMVNSWVRTSAAFAAAFLGDEALPAELDPSIRPPCGTFDVVLVFFDAVLGVDATVRPSPAKFSSDGLPQQFPMVDEWL
jgi:hypothetical protein